MEKSERSKVDIDLGDAGKANESSSTIESTKEATKGPNDKTTVTEVETAKGTVSEVEKTG